MLKMLIHALIYAHTRRKLASPWSLLPQFSDGAERGCPALFTSLLRDHNPQRIEFELPTLARGPLGDKSNTVFT